MSSNANLYAAIERRYPSDLDSCCIETLEGVTYSWRDMHLASGCIANWLRVAEAETRRPRRGAGRKITRVPDAVSGDVACGLGLCAVEHRLSARASLSTSCAMPSLRSSSARRQGRRRSSRSRAPHIAVTW